MKHRDAVGIASRVTAAITIVGAFTLSLTGCGGGGGTSTPVDPLAAGRSVLVNLASGSSNTSTQTLGDAFSLFQKAVRSNPGSSQARFGEAISLAGICGEGMDAGSTAASGGSSGAGSTGSTHLPGRSTTAITRGNAPSGGGSPGVGLVPDPPTTGTMPPSPPDDTTISAPVPGHNQLSLIWFLNRGLSNPNTLLEMLGPIADLRFGMMPFNGYFGDSSDVARRQKLLADLGTVADDLAIVEADANFTYTLPAPDQNGATVTIGLPEVYLFDAYVNSMRSEIALSLAYIRDRSNGDNTGVITMANTGSSNSAGSAPPPGISEPATSVTNSLVPYFGYLDKNNNGKLEPGEYLPASPFLTLRDASYLQIAQKAIAATADREQKGIAGVLARPTDGSGGYLLPNTPKVNIVLTRINTYVVPVIAQAAVGPFTLKFPRFVVNIYGTVTGGYAGGVFEQMPAALAASAANGGPNSGANNGPAIMPGVTIVKVKVNMAAWFANPPADIKAFAPTYPFISEGIPDFSAGVYPDPTYGGLFPDGLPSDLLN